jgi:molybdopterin-guanine dinucleotide biosynthesis protein B
VVGYKKSGKTTLVEQIIPLLISKGYRFGIIKYTGEGPEEAEGKDTAKFRAAGAEMVGLCGEDHFSLFKAGGHPALPLDRLAAFFFPDADLILTEGYKSAGKPAIEVVRSASEFDQIGDSGQVVAIASDVPLQASILVLDLNDVMKMADFIENRFLK